MPKITHLFASVALAVLMLPATSAFSDTAVTETTVTETRPQGPRVINFMGFDMNGDGILSTHEIGTMLFQIYDADGNEAIDNNEFERKSVVTIVPMEKNTVVSYDFDGDGKTDETRYTYETFLQDTQLTRFDQNKNGLSPHEFTGRFFMEADINNDKAVDIKEWQGSYIASIDKINKDKALFNK